MKTLIRPNIKLKPTHLNTTTDKKNSNLKYKRRHASNTELTSLIP